MVYYNVYLSYKSCTLWLRLRWQTQCTYMFARAPIYGWPDRYFYSRLERNMVLFVPSIIVTVIDMCDIVVKRLAQAATTPIAYYHRNEYVL